MDQQDGLIMNIWRLPMRANEFLREDGSAGATVAGSMAPISQSLGATISRTGITKPAKYANSAPVAKQRKKQNALG